MNANRLNQRINMLGPWLKKRFGGPVVKIGLDAGLGCPNRDGTIGREPCSFCPPGGSGRGLAGMPIEEQISAGLERLAQKAARRGRNAPKALAYYQAHTSTHAPAEKLAALLEPSIAAKGISGVIVSTRPDCLDAPRWEVLSHIAARSFFWLELGLQSAHDPTLERIGRGHTRAAFDAAVKEAERRGIKVAAHVILGLPGESTEHVNATARHLASLGVWGVKMHSLMVLEHTRLARQFRRGSFTPWARGQWAGAAAGFLARLPPKMLIHRLTADPGRDKLLAPHWVADKNRALGALAHELEAHNLEQGSLWQAKS